MADSITEGVLSSWEKRIEFLTVDVGDRLARDEVVANIETDKITLPVNAPQAGTLIEILVKEGDTVAVGSDLFKMDTEDTQNSPEATDSHSSTKDALKNDSAKNEKTEKESASKTESRQDKPREEIRSKGVEHKSAEPQLQPQVQSVGMHGAGKRVENRRKMTPMRTKIAARLKDAQNTAASLTTFNEIDMSALVELRLMYKDQILKTRNVKLGFMSPFVLAVCMALREFPAVNSRIEDGYVVEPSFVDVSVAVATPKGLVTPVIRDCHLISSFVEAETRLAALAEKAKSNGITPDDLAGGTFTISNGGIFGSLSGTPILNLPQSAILGMHAIKDRPVVVDGQIVVRPMMNVALTYDHRVIDGREAVSFLVRVKELLEDPKRMLLV